MGNLTDFIQQIIYILIFAVLVINFVFTAKALFAIGRKLELRKTGFAWVPFFSSFVTANISDKIDDITETDKKTGKKLRLTTITAGIIIIFTFFVFCFSIINIRDALFIREVSVVFTAFVYMMLLAFAVFMFYRFIYTILCTYKIFKQIQPDKAVKYIIISLVLPLAKAWLLCKCKSQFCNTEKSKYDCEVCDEPEE